MARRPSQKSGRSARASADEEAADFAPPGLPRPTAGPTVVVVDGEKGIFIPLDAADLTRDRSVDELAKMIESLQSVLIEKEREILGLNGRIAELLTPPQSPDDFSAALQSTVDSLQTELSHLSNPIANFAIKEFKIDTRVSVKIMPLGTVEYRFAGPGERINPDTQSQLSLTLVPVEKADSDRSDLDRHLAPLRPIAEIPDLADRKMPQGMSAQDYFESNHIYTIYEFLRVGTRANIQARIAAAIQIEPEVLRVWIDIAELLLLKDLNYPLVIRLQKAGINGMRGLKEADAKKTVAILKRPDISVEKFSGWQALAERYLNLR